jgi:Gas vesicle synthesis protein GvpL/GvpF
LSDGPILPLRFGTTAPDAAAVINEVLQPAAVLYTKQLDALDGLVELRFTVAGRELDELAVVAAEHPELRGAGANTGDLDERIALGEAVGAEMARRRQKRSALIIERIRPHCVSIQDQSNDDPTTSRVAALVQMDQLSRVDSAASQLFNDLGSGYECEYIGPMPAADFVDIEPHREQPDGCWGWTVADESAGNWGWQH